MNSKHAFSDRLKELQSWRSAVAAEIQQVSTTLRETQFLRAEDALRLAKCKQAAAAERVTLVFIAEIARGKSELINAIFFSDLGRRFLPSGLGRTTRCVTELRFDRDLETGVRCLPIETRESPRSFAELSLDPSQWHCTPFDADKPKSVAAALATLSETRLVSMADAVAWGLHNENAGKPGASKSGAPKSNDGAQVEVARWRHAIVNFPHPLLDSGLVILDTPGLAALSAAACAWWTMSNTFFILSLALPSTKVRVMSD